MNEIPVPLSVSQASLTMGSCSNIFKAHMFVGLTKIKLGTTWKKFMWFLGQEIKQESLKTVEKKEIFPLHLKKMKFSFLALLVNVAKPKTVFYIFLSCFPNFRPLNKVDSERKSLKSKPACQWTSKYSMESVSNLYV